MDAYRGESMANNLLSPDMLMDNIALTKRMPMAHCLI